MPAIPALLPARNVEQMKDMLREAPVDDGMTKRTPRPLGIMRYILDNEAALDDLDAAYADDEWNDPEWNLTDEDYFDIDEPWSANYLPRTHLPAEHGLHGSVASDADALSRMHAYLSCSMSTLHPHVPAKFSPEFCRYFLVFIERFCTDLQSHIGADAWQAAKWPAGTVYLNTHKVCLL